MFWKNVKISLLKYFYQKLKWRSLILQLTAVYTTSIVIIMLVIVSIVYLTLKHTFHKNEAGFLINEYQLIRHLIAMPKPKTALEQEIISEPAIFEHKNAYYLRIYNPNQNVLIETPGINKIIKENDFPKLKSNMDNFFVIKACHHCKKQMLLLSGSIKNKNEQLPWSIQIGLYTYKQAEMLQDYWQMLAIISILGTLIAALLGWWLAHRNIRPLHRIINIITAASTQKLPNITIANDWPSEFSVLAETLNTLFLKLDGSLKRLTQFSADLAHELRTPLNNLKGEAEIALLKLRTSDEYRQVLISSLEEYNRLARIIDGLLFLAKAEIPQKQLNLEYVDLLPLANKILEFYAPIAEEQSITLNCLGEGQLYIDEVLLQRALHNLCSNAIRHTPAGGQVNIEIESLFNKTLIRVVDTGSGISPEHIPYIFNRFYRVNNSPSNTGLGLAIVKSIVDLHGGSVHINSHIDKGTQVTMIFPKK